MNSPVYQTTAPIEFIRTYGNGNCGGMNALEIQFSTPSPCQMPWVRLFGRTATYMLHRDFVYPRTSLLALGLFFLNGDGSSLRLQDDAALPLFDYSSNSINRQISRSYEDRAVSHPSVTYSLLEAVTNFLQTMMRCNDKLLRSLPLFPILDPVLQIQLDSLPNVELL